MSAASFSSLSDPRHGSSPAVTVDRRATFGGSPTRQVVTEDSLTLPVDRTQA
jgi:hypothetical protein